MSIIQNQQVGFFGLGNMGYHMARNLARHLDSIGSPPLIVFNRTKTVSEKFVSELGAKAHVAKDLPSFALKCDILITNLASDAVVQDVYDQIAATLRVMGPLHLASASLILSTCNTAGTI